MVLIPISKLGFRCKNSRYWICKAIVGIRCHHLYEAVSVLTGEVLLNVQTRKTLLSYGSGGDVFRFIEQGTQLIEIEDGVGNNESVTYATRTAIEAVLEMIGH